MVYLVEFVADLCFVYILQSRWNIRWCRNAVRQCGSVYSIQFTGKTLFTCQNRTIHLL